MSPADYERLEQRAAELTSGNVSELIRNVLREWLDKAEGVKPKPAGKPRGVKPSAAVAAAFQAPEPLEVRSSGEYVRTHRTTAEILAERKAERLKRS